MKQLKFEHDYAQAIADNLRHATLRIDDKDIRVGDRIQLVDKVSSNKPIEWLVLGELDVVGVQAFYLKDMPLDLLAESEIATNDREELYQFLRRFYGDGLGDQTTVKLINFHFNPYQAPVNYMASQASVSAETEIPEQVFLYADGGSRGNPGPSAAGFVIEDREGNVLVSWNKYLGITTNNQAEYHGLIAALEWCRDQHIKFVDVRLDSLLVVNQMKGIFKVKNRDLWTLYETAKTLKDSFSHITFSHVPRELNTRADAEVNKALDSISGRDIVQ